jgi:hypothetical protein
MKKFILTLVTFLVLTSFVFAEGPYIYTKPCPKVESFTVIINDTLPGIDFMPETDGSCLINLATDFNFKVSPGLYKIEIFSENEYGTSESVFFNLRVFKTINSTAYKIEPINDPLMVNFDKDHLETAILKPGGGGKKGGGGGFGFFGLF